MPGVVRRGDPNSAGGIASSPSAPSVQVNNRPVCVTGDSVTPHPCCGDPLCPPIHCSAKTVARNSSVFAEGKPIVTVGTSDTCGHGRSSGSNNVFIG